MLIIVDTLGKPDIKVYDLHTFCRDLMLNPRPEKGFYLTHKEVRTFKRFICTRKQEGIHNPNSECMDCPFYYHKPRQWYDDMKRIGVLLERVKQ